MDNDQLRLIAQYSALFISIAAFFVALWSFKINRYAQLRSIGDLLEDRKKHLYDILMDNVNTLIKNVENLPSSDEDIKSNVEKHLLQKQFDSLFETKLKFGNEALNKAYNMACHNYLGKRINKADFDDLFREEILEQTKSKWYDAQKYPYVAQYVELHTKKIENQENPYRALVIMLLIFIFVVILGYTLE